MNQALRKPSCRAKIWIKTSFKPGHVWILFNSLSLSISVCMCVFVFVYVCLHLCLKWLLLWCVCVCECVCVCLCVCTFCLFVLYVCTVYGCMCVFSVLLCMHAFRSPSVKWAATAVCVCLCPSLPRSVTFSCCHHLPLLVFPGHSSYTCDISFPGVSPDNHDHIKHGDPGRA